MSGVIKSGSLPAPSSVRSIFSAVPASAPAPPAPDPELERLRLEIGVLKDALEEREREVESLEGRLRDTFRNGYEDGREAGRREADERRDRALALLEKGVERALARLGEELQSTERLAALLARTSLERLFGAAGDRGALVCDLVRHQVGGLEADAIVQVRVSAADFPDEAGLAAVAASAGGAVSVKAVRPLKSGDCTIKLRLGGLDIGLDQQWGTLRGLLDRLSEPGAGR